MRRLLVVLVLVAGCGSMHRFEDIQQPPMTCFEACLEKEALCLESARLEAGGVSFLLFFYSSTNSGEVIVRQCQIENELCRMRHCDKTRTAPTPDAGMP